LGNIEDLHVFAQMLKQQQQKWSTRFGLNIMHITTAAPAAEQGLDKFPYTT